MTALGFIPARGGSKGIPRKNLALLGGKPLIAHTIEAARQSRRLDRLVVSTEDPEIADVASHYGVEVLMRPPELAADETPMLPVAMHVLEVLSGRSYRPDLFVTLHPTSPFRSPGLIDRAVTKFLTTPGIDAVLTVSPVNPRIGSLQRGFFIPDGDPEHPAPVYVDAGAVYVNRVAQLVEGRSFVGRRAHVLVLDKIEGLDVNTPLDLKIAQTILEQGRFTTETVKEGIR